ncbi:DUF4129 domain-containing protein [Nocardioides psychrotolerans]|uniref:Protein-glutamine gamma-glutamyltransferase-like C-terminal domain-containing protein n=1 Tax=Nocardioides psychrotolerans TaxID=1005945 RepID=A0A1I3L9N1_9ACTN|nr:DUF4129 domain-containing protein [Nocardioides psychrotolerans]SFI81095.1 protein of unknown function [Nocardioides psychrotolerans]
MADARQPRSGSSALAVLGVLAVTGLLLVLGTWAASIGPDDVADDQGSADVSLSRNTDANTATGPRAVPDPQPRRSQERESSGWVQPLATVLSGALALLVVLYVGRRVVAVVRRVAGVRRNPRQGTPPEVDFDTLPQHSPAVAQAILEDASDQRGTLAEGTPRHAIVACWHRFESQAAGVGVARLPHETSSEFTLRLLDLVAADRHSVSRLAALYREARFSDHELDEQARDQARAALDDLHADLAQRWAARLVDRAGDRDRVR